MFPSKPEEHSTRLEDTIDNLLSEMAGFAGHSEEYSKMASQVQKLYELKEHDAPKQRISPDTLMTVGGNLLAVLIIVGYERANVITSKALGMIFKVR